MADGEFSRGEQVWLGGREVTFLEYLCVPETPPRASGPGLMERAVG
jgi:hypothetical protein